MRVGAVVQARMSSGRLPGKVLREIEGKALLGYLLERLERCAELDAIIVATSTDATDNPVVAYCQNRGTTVVRGPLNDVAARFLQAAELHRLDGFVRVSGDSPLLDPHVVDAAAERLRHGGCDLVTNVFPRTWPHGQSVEAVCTDVFVRASDQMQSAEDREHVTAFFYRHAASFRICALEPAGHPAPDLAVDTEEDFMRVVAVIGRMTRPQWEYGLAELAELGRHKR
jgi:spore coat polysaccharide biosynthesis protein SpsF